MIVKAESVFPYARWVAASLRGLKYESERDRGAFLGALLAWSAAGPLLADADYVVSIPMYRKQELRRGYNQAEVLAKAACRTLGRDGPVELLSHPYERESQVGLNADERRANVRGAFALNEGVAAGTAPHKRFVLIDDVRTTGSTLTAAVDTLRPLRPSRIDIVTVAAELSAEVHAQVLPPWFDET